MKIENQMIYFMAVYESLKSSVTPEVPLKDQDSLVSRLIHDFFGGEILKTPIKNGWHFYNRIDGLRIDFTRPDFAKSMKESNFVDIPSAPDETYCFYEEEEYSSFLMRFVRAFEDVIGLKKNQTDFA